MEFLGINSTEGIILVVLALVLLGPEQLKSALKSINMSLGAVKNISAQLRERANATDIELNLEQINPSKLDPRTMIRSTLKEELQAWSELGKTDPGTTPEKKQ